MDWLLPSIPYIVALQKDPRWLPVMKLLSALGSFEFFLVVLPLSYWCLNRRFGWQIGLLVVANAAVNDILKIFFSLPRPFWVSHAVHPWGSTEASFGLPSGHTQGSIAFWLFIALQYRMGSQRMLAATAAVGLTLLIALSRVYLGMHFPLDTLAGAIFGAIFLVLYRALALPWSGRYRNMPFRTQVLLACIVPALALVVFWIALRMPPSPHTNSYVNYLGEARGASAISDRLGTLTGLLLGLLWVGREHRFAVDGPNREKIARFLLGAVGVLLIWRGLAWVLFKITPQDADTLVNIGRFGRYFLLTWWVSAGAPQLFIKLQMLRREDPALGVA